MSWYYFELCRPLIGDYLLSWFIITDKTVPKVPRTWSALFNLNRNYAFSYYLIL